MKQRHILSLAAATASMTASALPVDFYAPKSVLADNIWVKIGVDKTGIYEISYDELRGMGFANPENIALYGRGGAMMPCNFTDKEGNPLITDDLSPLPVMHRDGKIYFYGQGIESYSFVPDAANTSTGGSFRNNGINIYSRRGYYFLTDRSAPATNMSEKSLPQEAKANAVKTERGAGFVFHEADLEQNNSNTGQLFWGERFNNGHPDTYRWDVEMPDLIKGEDGVMECVYYSERGVRNAWVEYGVTGADKVGHIDVSDFASVSFRPQEPKVSPVEITGPKTSVYVTANQGNGNDGTANMDYWTLTYPKRIPTLRDSEGKSLAQDFIVLPGSQTGETLEVALSEPKGKVVFDVTDPANPVILPIESDGAEGTVYVEVGGKTPALMVFDTSRHQLGISGYGEGYDIIGNQNLHALKGEPVDMIIIATADLADKAEQIAALHREKDGMNVAVATAGEVYNEFSGGVPDPMAYRSFCKMVYDSSDGHLKNLLLMGPLYGDFRGINVERDHERGLIAYQNPTVNAEKGAYNVNDFYGMMDDFIKNLDTEMHYQNVHLGVGILPCYYPVEADNYIKKLNRFYDDADNLLFSANRRLYLGGVGDNHTHDRQAKEISEYVDNNNMGKMVNSLLMINAYGNDRARTRLLETLNSGVAIATYIGHGAPTMLGKDKKFFAISHLGMLRNRQLPLMVFAGCEISYCDRGQRGIGETLVIDNPCGSIASVLSTRATWSGQNMEFLKMLNSSFTHDIIRKEKPYLDYPPTLGEAFAATKTCSNYSNELAYQILGDPAIRLPMPLRRAEVHSEIEEIVPVAGQSVEITGVLKTKDYEVDRDFNGRIVARLLEPLVEIESEDLVTEEPTKLTVPYCDSQVSVAVGKVEAGEFSVRLDIPALMAGHIGKNAYIHLSALDPDTRVSMAHNITVAVADPASRPDVKPVEDTTPPVIESVTYDDARKMLVIEASDDTALNLSRGGTAPGMRVHIDGRFMRNGSESMVIPTGDGAAAYRREVALLDLGYGRHSARVEVADAAGNTAESEVTFDFTPGGGISFGLALEETAVAGKATFTLSDAYPATGLLTVVDTDGHTVFTSEIHGGRLEWDAKGRDGVPLAPGRYKAFVVETGNKGTRGFSNTVDVPVI